MKTNIRNKCTVGLINHILSFVKSITNTHHMLYQIISITSALKCFDIAHKFFSSTETPPGTWFWGTVHRSQQIFFYLNYLKATIFQAKLHLQELKFAGTKSREQCRWGIKVIYAQDLQAKYSITCLIICNELKLIKRA